MGSDERPAPTAAPGCIAALVGLAVVFGGLAALFVKAGNALEHVGSGFNLSFASNEEHPIPIPKAACPYLRTVHDTADASGRLYVEALNARKPNRGSDSGARQSWSSFRSASRLTLAGFDDALSKAVPHVPPRVAARLDVVLTNVRSGERELGTATSYAEYTNATSGDVLAGLGALDDASGLVGNACGFTLSPSV